MSHPIADRNERDALLTSLMRDPDLDPRYRMKALELLAKAAGDYVTKVHVDMDTQIRQMSEAELRAELARLTDWAQEQLQVDAI